MSSILRSALVLSVLVMIAGQSPAWAQLRDTSPVAPGTPRPRPMASAAHVTEAPVVDGTLDDRVWQNAAPLDGFVQAEPFEGQPGSERTDVRILYDDQAIYVGVTCYDRDP